jgi:hypothetical protein
VAEVQKSGRARRKASNGRQSNGRQSSPLRGRKES